MSNDDSFQLYSKKMNINDNILQENQKNSQKKKTRNKTKNKTEDEIKVELIIKNNNKTESTQDKTKFNGLILPKIETNNALKQSHENDIKYLSQSNEIPNPNNKISNQKETKNLTVSNENNININNEKKSSNDNIILNEKENKEKSDIDEQKFVEVFNKNKKRIMKICIEIEENLNNIYLNSNKNENDDNAMNKSQNINSLNDNNTYKISKEQKEVIKKINNYKKRIKSAQEELDAQLKLNKADQLESILKERKKYLENIKRENDVLKNIKNFQEKDEKEIKNIQTKKEDLYSVNEKINKIKDEAKIKKDYNHTLSEKIKTQNEQINTLKDRCNLINQNIEYFKKKQIHLNQNQNNDIENNNNNLELLDLNEIKKIYDEKIERIAEKQEKMKYKIKEQNIKIEELTSNNESLSVNIDKIMMKTKNNMNKIISYERQLRKKENLLYDSIIKNKKRNTLSDRKPFHIGPINEKPKIKKIFDYQKYLKESEKNKKKIKLYTSVDGESKKSKPKTLLEIETLRNDIQSAIRKNELDEQIEKIIHKLKDGNTQVNKNIKINKNNDEDDVLNNLFKKNEEINGSNRYNFYVTEGANLPVPLKKENINDNLNTNY